MTGPAFETFLARLYADGEFRATFLKDPRAATLKAGLSAGECDALEKIDREGLELAAGSYARKREGQLRGKIRAIR